MWKIDALSREDIQRSPSFGAKYKQICCSSVSRFSQLLLSLQLLALTMGIGSVSYWWLLFSRVSEWMSRALSPFKDFLTLLDPNIAFPGAKFPSPMAQPLGFLAEYPNKWWKGIASLNCSADFCGLAHRS